MAEYYFLTTYLPSLSLKEKPELSFEELDFLLKQNLGTRDYEKTFLIRLFADLENLRLFWNNLDGQFFLTNQRGNFDLPQIKEISFLASGFEGENKRWPYWISDYLDLYQTSQERLTHFPQLWKQFFEVEVENQTGFLKDYLSFEREFRLHMAALRAKRMGYSFHQTFENENHEDSLVLEILEQAEAKEYFPKEGFEELASIFNQYATEPNELSEALLVYKLQRIDELGDENPFSIDRILAFLAKFILIESFQDSKNIEGAKILDSINRENES